MADDSEIIENVDIPETETLIVGEVDIRQSLKNDRPTTFTADEQNLRYTVSVEVWDKDCDREGCDDTPIFESTDGDWYCSPGCLQAGTREENDSEEAGGTA